MADNTTAVCAIARHRRRLGDEKCGDVQTRQQRLLLSLIERFRGLSLFPFIISFSRSLVHVAQSFTGNVMNTIINMFIINVNKPIISLNKDYLSLIIVLLMFEAQFMACKVFSRLMCISVYFNNQYVCSKYSSSQISEFCESVFFLSRILFSNKSRFGKVYI